MTIFLKIYIYAINHSTLENAFAGDNNSRSNLSDDEVKNDEVKNDDVKNGRLQTLLKQWLITSKYYSEEVLEESICLEFLFELKRIIVDLGAATMLVDYKKQFIIEPRNRYKEASLLSRGSKNLVESGKFLVSLSSAYLGDVRVKYDIFLREYVIMTGNFATILSRYSLDYNKLTQKDKDIIRGEVTKDMQPIEDKLIIIENKIQQAAIGGIENAKAEAEAEAEAAAEAQGAATATVPEGEKVDKYIQEQGRVNGEGGGKIIHNRPKKHSKKYKIYKKYKHSKKIKNKRKQKQY